MGTVVLSTILFFILIGAVIGVLARLIVPGPNPIGLVMTIIVGIAGSILGGIVAHALGAGSLLAFIFSILIAAVGVVFLTRAESGGPRSRRRVFW